MSYTYNPTSYTYTVANTTSASTTGSWYNVDSITNGDLKPATIQVKGNSEFDGDAEFNGDIKVQGKSLKESLEQIEERLAILRPNEELEEKWERLRGLRKMYMELEAEIIEKEQIWSILKK